MPPRPIKVLFAINCLNIGGAPSVVVNQLKSLDKDKFAPYLLTLYPSKAANFLVEVDSFLPAEQQRHFRLKNRSIFDVKTLWQIYRFLRAEQFDLVYTHLFLTNLLVRALAILAGVKAIVVFEHSTYFNKRRWQVWADRLLNLFTAKIIVSTETVAQFTKEQQRLSADKIIVLPNPVMLPMPAEDYLCQIKSDFHLTEGEKVFVTIGRFSLEKGHNVLLEAAARAGVKAKFLIVGHGPGEPLIKKKIAELGIGDLAAVICEPERAKQFLYVSDAFILPSLREGQGLVAYEALLAGRPVISSDLPALQEIITPEANGLLFKTGSSDDLALMLKRLVTEPELLPRLQAGARETDLKHKVREGSEELADLFISLVSAKR